MDEGAVFYRLVRNLSSSERQELIARLKSSWPVIKEPLVAEAEEEREVNIEHVYHELNFFYKLWFFLKTLFLSKNLHTLVEENLINQLGKSIEKQSPGLIDPYTKQLTPELFHSIETLKNTLMVFNTPLTNALGPLKKDFFAFIGGMEMEEIQHRLLNELDPDQIVRELGSDEEQIVNQELQERFVNIFNDITPKDREKMYQYSKNLFLLGKITFYNYDKLLASTMSGYSYKKGDYTSQAILNLLLDLADILNSFVIAPDIVLIQALFLFNMQENIDSSDLELAALLDRNVKNALKAIEQIKTFNQSVPLINIIKFLTGIINYRPKNIGGGEDWFALFTQFWQKRVKEIIEGYSLEQERKTVIRKTLELLHWQSFQFLTYFNPDYLGINIKHAYTLSFVKGLVEGLVLQELNHELKTITLHGKFYKKQNKLEYSDAYNGLIKNLNQIIKLDSTLAPQTDAGKVLEELKAENPHDLKAITAKLQYLELDAEDILILAQNNLFVLKNVIQGILLGKSGERYDTLSNLNEIMEGKNHYMIKRLTEILNKLDQGFSILNSLIDIENSTA